MIFLTVGTQLPFDRLVSAVDAWAADRGRGSPGADDGGVFAQIGPGARYRPRYIQWAESIPPRECRRRMEAADLVIAHAGMGTILEALVLGKPVIVMPRRADLHEHRNDHQLATARYLAEKLGIKVAMDEASLRSKLDHAESVEALPRIGAAASPMLLNTIGDFLAGVPRPVPTIRRVVFKPLEEPATSDTGHA